jgi:cystathionine beta-lyase family protein involved in aluminum resistance
MVLHNRPNPVDFLPAEAVAILQANRFKPEFGLTIVTLDMHVRRFIGVACIKEKSVRSAAQYCRQRSSVLLRVEFRSKGKIIGLLSSSGKAHEAGCALDPRAWRMNGNLDFLLLSQG